MQPFAHLHVHSQYSTLDGQASIRGIVDKAMSDGMPAIALTDHGVMYGVKDFINYVNRTKSQVKKDLEKLQAELEKNPNNQKTILEIESLNKKLNFKPIIGCECYCARRDRFQMNDKVDASGWHLVVLAKNLTGYKNLIKMVSKSWTEGYYYRPRIDKQLLEEYKEGLIISSACLGGEISRKIDDGDIEGAEESVQWFKKVFGEDYYIAIQRHKTSRPDADQTTYVKQERVNIELIRIAKKFEIGRASCRERV